MKAFFFNLYKIWYINHFKFLNNIKTENQYKFLSSDQNNQKKIYSDESDSNAKLFACCGVFFFIYVLFMNLKLFMKLVFDVQLFNFSKGIIVVAFLVGVYVTYYLLFKILKLPDLNYFHPEHRLPKGQRRKLWAIVIFNVLLLFLMLFIFKYNK